MSGVWDWIYLLRPLRLALCVWCLRLDMSVTSITPSSVCLVSETGYVCYDHYASLCVSGLYVCYVHHVSLCVSGVWDWICLLRPLRLALCVWCLRQDMSVTSITPRSVCLVYMSVTSITSRSVCLVSETGYVCYVHYASLCVSGLYVCYVHHVSLCVSGVWDWICLLRPSHLALCVWAICLLRPSRLALCVWCLRLDMSVTSITPRSVSLVSETGYVCYVHYASLCVWCLRLDMSVTSITSRSVCLVSETGYVCYVHYVSLCVSGVWDWICLLRPLRLALCVWCLRLDMSVTSITLRSVSGVWDWICLLRPLRLALCVWCLRLDMSVTSITPRSVCLVSETGYVCYVHYAPLCVSGVWDWICLLRPSHLALCVWAICL